MSQIITIGKPKTIRDTTKKIESLRLKYLNTLLMFLCLLKNLTKPFLPPPFSNMGAKICFSILYDNTYFLLLFQAIKLQGYQCVRNSSIMVSLYDLEALIRTTNA